MPYGSVLTDSITDSSGGVLAPSSSVFRNRIINGDMRIDQRNAGASITPISAQYSVDRWACALSQASKYTVQQNAASVTPPTGFKNYLGATSSSAYSVLTGDAFYLYQGIEGLNVADLAWGTANAQTVTLSFWVRSSLTGTFGGSIINSAANRSYPFAYTINSANTWEKETITIAGDTSGTWLTTNGAGLYLIFSLGAGATNSGTAGAWAGSTFYSATGATSVVGTNGATFYITGVQLEKGSTATSFDYRPYGDELSLCQRYYYRISAANSQFAEYGSGYIRSTTLSEVLTVFPVSMRTAPTALEQSGTAAHYGVLNLNTTTACTSVPTFNYATVSSGRTSFTTGATLVAGQGCMGRSENTSAYLGWSAEL